MSVVPTIACVDVPALPLQLLRRRESSTGSKTPLAVVEDDHPQAKVLWIDQAAARYRIRTGMRYAAALQLCPSLRASVISDTEINTALKKLAQRLMNYSPRVEIDRKRSGVLWIDPSGLGNLFGPLERWAVQVSDTLEELCYEHAVVIGYNRLSSWAVARTRSGPYVLASPAEEARFAGRAPLWILEFPHEIRDALTALGIGTLDGFLGLPRGEVGLRFGKNARDLHARFSDALRDPLSPFLLPEPIVAEAELDPPDDNVHRILFSVKGALHALIAELNHRGLALATLELTLKPEGHDPVRATVEPARPTRDALSIMELVRLRLNDVVLPSRAEHLTVEAIAARLDGTQLPLFASRCRDPDAPQRGIARLRAAFGDDAITRARLRDGWLPEQRFAWEPTDRIDPPKIPPRATDLRSGNLRAGIIVRRLRTEPYPIGKDRHGRPVTDRHIVRLIGPYRFQSGWWDLAPGEVARDYFYGEVEDGSVLWLFRDRANGRWFIHGHWD